VAIRRLLVPLDGSTYAERALPFAAALASATGAGITVASVRTPQLRERLDVDHSDLPTYLHWVRHWLLPYVDDVNVALVDAPSPLDGLLGFERRGEVDLTVTATHARRGAERLFLGSVVDGLVRAGHTPVLAVPPPVEPPVGRIPLMSRVIVPLDGSELAEQALGPMLGWLGGPVPSELAPCEVVLLAVEGAALAARDAERYLRGVRERLVPRLRAAVGTRVVQGAPAAMIVAAADDGLIGPTGERMATGLVVMATHGRGGVERWLYGSVAQYVLTHVHIPVLLVHPPQVDM
jgi:nucleotide-binding universal stress UspA family protein